MKKIVSLIKLVIDFFIKYRYVIALVVSILLISAKINFSSIGIWDNYISERDDGKTTDIILGKNRQIRSDEWMVQTPFYLSQSESDLNVNNPNYGISGQNMIIAYNAPVKDITIIGKPFNWGYLFLDKEHAFSFYWVVKLIGMLLLAFEVSMILTNRRKYLSIFCSFWISFSPAIQWWFMQHLGDLIFFTLLLMIAIYYYFTGNRKLVYRLIWSIVIAFSCIGFILVIYPAFQVTLAYFILAWLVGIPLIYRKEIRFDWWDVLFVLLSFSIIGFVMLHFYEISKEALHLTLNTVYPGKRFKTGGVTNPVNMGAPLVNWLIPFIDINLKDNLGRLITNNCDISSFYHFLPLVLLSIPFINNGAKQEKQFKLSYIFLSFIGFMSIWLFIGFPKVLAKLTLLSYTVEGRDVTIYYFVSMLFSIWFMSQLDYLQLRNKKLTIYIALLFGTINAMIFSQAEFAKYTTKVASVVIFIVLVSLAFSLLSKNWKIFIPLMATIIFISGCTVNPIVQGIGAITEKKLAHAVDKIVQKDPDAVWLSEGQLTYNFLPSLGVHTLNSVRFYPDMPLMEQISKNPKKESRIYNRYQHMNLELITEPTNFELIYTDSIKINLNIEELNHLDVRYVLSQRDLSLFDSNNIQFQKIYGPDSDGFMIFELN